MKSSVTLLTRAIETDRGSELLSSTRSECEIWDCGFDAGGGDHGARQVHSGKCISQVPLFLKKKLSTNIFHMSSYIDYTYHCFLR